MSIDIHNILWLIGNDTATNEIERKPILLSPTMDDDGIDYISTITMDAIKSRQKMNTSNSSSTNTKRK